ncbi:MAG: lanthionine synthetase LanC family protein [Blautia wexlerae]
MGRIGALDLVVLRYVYVIIKRITKRDKYMKYISKMIEYENKLYDSKIKNWKDIRGINSGDGVAWCHGAAGILRIAEQFYRKKKKLKIFVKKI